MFFKRLPVGSLLRDETNNDIYLVVKLEVVQDSNIVYYLCKIYDSTNQCLDSPYTFFFILNDEEIKKFTVLNTKAVIRTDGTLFHILDTIQFPYTECLVSNDVFVLRFLSLVKNFSNSKNKVFNVAKINNKNKTVTMERKTCFVERFLSGAKVLGYEVNWIDLFNEFIPVLHDLDVSEFKNISLDNCLKCGVSCSK